MLKEKKKKIKMSEYFKKLKYFIYVNLFCFRRYDRKYFKSLFFKGPHFGILCDGWEWAYFSYKNCKRLNKNTKVPWPVSPFVTIVNPNNIFFSPNDLNNFQSYGIYFQAIGKIFIGEGTLIGPNVGLITANHKIDNLLFHQKAKDINIGKKCWIGMNSIILPGTILGDSTIVAANSVVKGDFSMGNCIIAGNPAKVVKENSLEKK